MKKIKIQITSLVLLGIFVFGIVVNTLVSAYADTRINEMGTNASLGSPILSSGVYNTEKWNKWESIVFGIYLSNYCEPLVDNYQSAFQKGGSIGSKGAGRDRLIFSTGDTTSSNSAMIDNLVNECIEAQFSSPKKLYVKYFISNGDGQWEEETTQENEDIEARFCDLLIATHADDSKLHIDYGSSLTKQGEYVGKIKGYIQLDVKEIKDSVYEKFITKAKVPAFYILKDDKPYYVWDYREAWDYQMANLLFTHTISSNLKEEFVNNFNNYYQNDVKIGFDSFGNIITQQNCNIIFPASTNSHLMKNERMCNLLTSFIMNNYANLTNSTETAQRLQCALSKTDGAETSGWWGTENNKWILNSSIMRMGKVTGWGLAKDKLHSITDNNIFKNGNTLIYQSSSSLSNKDTTELDYYKNSLKTIEASFEKGKAKNVGLTINSFMDFPEVLEESTVTLKDGVNSDAVALIYSFNRNVDLMTSYLNNNNTYLNELSFTTSNKSADNWFTEEGIYSATIQCDENQKDIVREYFNSEIKAFYNDNKNVLYAIKSPQLAKGLFVGGVDNSGKISNADGQNISYRFVDYIQKKSNALYKKKAEIIAINAMEEAKKYHLDYINDSREENARMSYPLIDNAYRAGKNFSSFIDSVGLEFRSGYQDFGTSTSRNRYCFANVAKLYKINSSAEYIFNYLQSGNGEAFEDLSSNLYYTYLKWYGIYNNGSINSGNLNETLFNENSNILNVDIAKIVPKSKSEEELKKETLNYSYLMLHPEEGMKYRLKMIESDISNFFYDLYQKTVYNDITASTKASNSFLNVHNYSENILTSWFMPDKYFAFCIIVIGVLLIFFTIKSLYNDGLGHNIWQLVVIAGVLLILPTIIEFLPYQTNKTIQGWFNENVSYWAITNDIENDNISNKSLETDFEFIKLYYDNISSLQVEKSICYKNDISTKVVNTTDSTNSLLALGAKGLATFAASLVHISSAEDNSADYLYVPLTDLYDKCAYLSIAFDDSTALMQNSYIQRKATETINYEDDEFEKPSENDKVGLWWGGYTSVNCNDTTEEAESLLYMKTYRSLSQSKDDINLTHTSFWLLNNIMIPSFHKDGNTFELDKSELLGKYAYANIDNSTTSDLQVNLVQKTNDMLEKANDFVLTEKPLDRDFGYLWLTENIYPYFYLTIKDTYPSYLTVPQIMGELQGGLGVDEEGNSYRETFMHYSGTDYTRDFLDLEELFTNVVPYIYEIDLLAGGKNGNDGLLGDNKIGDKYAIYKDNKMSWMYRCNWVTKIVENPSFQDTTIRDSKGKRYHITNQTMPQYYPLERPMVFSEAQMKVQGLHTSDLSTFELLLIDVNKEVASKWTELLNYSNTESLRSEHIERQMALEAMMIFNKKMSTGITNTSKILYPQNLDLRAISFDRILTLMVLGETSGAGYSQDNTIGLLMESKGILFSILIVVLAFLNVTILPIVRDFLSAILLVGTVFILLKKVYQSRQTSENISKDMGVVGAFAIGNILIFLVNAIYFYLIMLQLPRGDYMRIINTSFLRDTQITGNLTMKLILVLAYGLAYCYLTFVFLKILIENKDDLGWSYYVTKFNNAVAKIGNWATSTTASTIDGISTFMSNESYVGAKKEETNNTNNSNEDVSISNEEIDTTSYQTNTNYQEEQTQNETQSINEQINKGKTTNDISTTINQNGYSGNETNINNETNIDNGNNNAIIDVNEVEYSSSEEKETEQNDSEIDDIANNDDVEF